MAYEYAAKAPKPKITVDRSESESPSFREFEASRITPATIDPINVARSIEASE